jgi:hypothetical protein
MNDENLLARIDRLESADQIRQLAPKYALCIDMRDLDSLVNLFVDDVGVPGKQPGKQPLRSRTASPDRCIARGASRRENA